MHASDDPQAPLTIGGATHVVGVIGWPVGHSLSPAIHNAAFSSLGMDWVYVPLPVPPGAMRAAADGLVGLGLRGANVTMPHKTETADLVDELSEDARRLRAVNTLVVDVDRLLGHNTDTPGFDRFLRRDAGFDPAGRSALFGRRRPPGGRARPGAAGAAELRVTVQAIAPACCSRDQAGSMSGVPFDERAADVPISS
jgi:shikimate dehydrogenase